MVFRDRLWGMISGGEERRAGVQEICGRRVKEGG